MSKSIFSSLGKNDVFSHIRSQEANLFTFLFKLIRRIVGPNKDDSDQHSRMRFLICMLNAIWYFSVIFMSCVGLFQKSSFCLNARVRNILENS